jgi:phosphoribosyl-ATP pyrophosphohydrolase
MKDCVDPAIIAEIWSIIEERAKNPSQESYTSQLLSDKKGIDKVLVYYCRKKRIERTYR